MRTHRGPQLESFTYVSLEILMLTRQLLLLWMFAVGAFLPGSPLTAQTKTDRPVREQLIGAWRLVSIETIRANGDVIYPFYGKHPEGLIMYDRSGWMSVQIVSDPKPSVPAVDSRESFMAAPAAEKIKAVEGYYAYCGTWTLDASNATVTHHIKQSLLPGEPGEDGVRHLVLDGDRLILTAKTHEMSEDHERKLVWQRVRVEQP
jgi:hypothetical protein